MINTRVKDIDFKSADHVIEEIRNMNVKGGSPFGRSAAWAFKLAVEQENLNDFNTLKVRLEDVAQQMLTLKPTMATIHNSCDIVFSLLDDSKDLENLKKEIVKVCENIIEQSFLAVEKVAEYGANLISDGDTILMHSYSSTLMGIFKAARNQGKNFKLICTESRPLRESRNAVNILIEIGVDTTFISDASVYEFMKSADLIIMGADSLSTDGSVANKMGSAQIACLARSCKVPVYFASELYKLDLRTQYGYNIQLERRTPFELVCTEDFNDFDKVKVINQFFDITPANDIKGIITEFGILHPSQMAAYWNELINNILED